MTFACPAWCGLGLTLGPPLAALLGVASHLLYFIHGERDKEAGRLAVFFAAAYLALAVLMGIVCLSLSAGLCAATLLTASFHLALLSSIGIYRVLFHRLHRFPGPRLGVLSKWHAVYVAHATQRLHARLYDYHKRYGHVVRTGPRELSINLSEAIGPVYGPQSPCLKGPWYDLGGTGLNLHRTRDPVLHAKQRPLWERGIKEISGNIKKIEQKTDQLLNGLHGGRGADVASVFGLFAFNLASCIIFSEDVDHGRPGRNPVEDPHEAYRALRESQAALGTFGQAPWLYAVNAKFPFLIPQNTAFTDFAQKMVDKRKQNTPDEPDLFTYLLPTENDPTSAGFPLSWEARLALVAGSGNISAGLSAITFYLATHKETLESLQRELDPLFEAGTFDPSQRPSVLSSVIFETFRLQSMVPNGGERVTPPEGLRIGEMFIPGNCVIRVPSWTIFRDDRYFDRPEEWIPERWTSKPHLVRDRSAFIPFSTGPYNCVGRQLGMMVIALVVARLVNQLDLVLSAGQDPSKFADSGRDHFGIVFVPGSLHVDFLPRKKEKVREWS